MIIEKIKSSSFSNIVPRQISKTSSRQGWRSILSSHPNFWILALPDLSQEKSGLGLGEVSLLAIDLLIRCL
jgi:hypothetical protein